MENERKGLAITKPVKRNEISMGALNLKKMFMCLIVILCRYIFWK